MSGELSLLSNRESTMSGGGKTKPDSWPEDGGTPLRGEKAISEAELTRVLEVDSAVETGVAKDNADATEGVEAGMTAAEASEKAVGIASKAGDWELEPELEGCGDWRERWGSRWGAAGNRRAGWGKSDIKPGGGAREEEEETGKEAGDESGWWRKSCRVESEWEEEFGRKEETIWETERKTRHS